MWPYLFLFANSPGSGELLLVGCGVVAVAWGIGASAAYGAAIPVERRVAVHRVLAKVRSYRAVGDIVRELDDDLFDCRAMLHDCNGELTAEQMRALAERLECAARSMRVAHSYLAERTIALVSSWVAGQPRQEGGGC